MAHIKVHAYTTESEYVQKTGYMDNDYPWVLRTYERWKYLDI